MTKTLEAKQAQRKAVSDKLWALRDSGKSHGVIGSEQHSALSQQWNRLHRECKILERQIARTTS